MSKQKTIDRAQWCANKDGKPLVVLNLNQFSPLYVIRDYDPRYEGDRQLVTVIRPQAN